MNGNGIDGLILSVCVCVGGGRAGGGEGLQRNPEFFFVHYVYSPYVHP